MKTTSKVVPHDHLNHTTTPIKRSKPSVTTGFKFAAVIIRVLVGILPSSSSSKKVERAPIEFTAEEEMEMKKHEAEDIDRILQYTREQYLLAIERNNQRLIEKRRQRELEEQGQLEIISLDDRDEEEVKDMDDIIDDLLSMDIREESIVEEGNQFEKKERGASVGKLFPSDPVSLKMPPQLEVVREDEEEVPINSEFSLVYEDRYLPKKKKHTRAELDLMIKSIMSNGNGNPHITLEQIVYQHSGRIL